MARQRDNKNPKQVENLVYLLIRNTGAYPNRSSELMVSLATFFRRLYLPVADIKLYILIIIDSVEYI